MNSDHPLSCQGSCRNQGTPPFWSSILLSKWAIFQVINFRVCFLLDAVCLIVLLMKAFSIFQVPRRRRIPLGLGEDIVSILEQGRFDTKTLDYKIRLIVYIDLAKSITFIFYFELALFYATTYSHSARMIWHRTTQNYGMQDRIGSEYMHPAILKGGVF